VEKKQGLVWCWLAAWGDMRRSQGGVRVCVCARVCVRVCVCVCSPKSPPVSLYRSLGLRSASLLLSHATGWLPAGAQTAKDASRQGVTTRVISRELPLCPGRRGGLSPRALDCPRAPRRSASRLPLSKECRISSSKSAGNVPTPSPRVYQPPLPPLPP